MKVIVIGANHAGTSAIRTLLGLGKNNVEVTAYDRNSNISFLGCGMALWVDDTVKDVNGLFYADKELLTKMGAKIRMNHDVTEIDTKNKKIKAIDQITGKQHEESYDKLIYAAGSWPIVPPFPGKELENVAVAKIFQHAEMLKRYADDKHIKDVVIVGAGYIGIEFAEAFHKAHKNVTLIDVIDRPINRYFDADFTKGLEKAMADEKVIFMPGEKVCELKGENGKLTHVLTDSKKMLKADLALLAIGFRPNSDLLPEAKKIRNGAIVVDKSMRTSIPDVYAIGDVAAIPFIPLNDEPCNIALATNAVKTGVAAAADICGLGAHLNLPGITGTNAIHVFGQTLTSTGISETFAKQLNIDVESTSFEDNDRPEFMGDASKNRVRIKIIARKSDKVIVGAQIASLGKHDHSDSIYFLSLAIQQKLTVYQVAMADFFFLPHLNKPFNFIIKAALGNPEWLQGTATHPLGEEAPHPITAKSGNGSKAAATSR